MQTVVKMANNPNPIASFEGDQDPKAIQDNLIAFVPNIKNCSYTVSTLGAVKTITFSEKLGTKGC